MCAHEYTCIYIPINSFCEFEFSNCKYVLPETEQHMFAASAVSIVLNVGGIQNSICNVSSDVRLSSFSNNNISYYVFNNNLTCRYQIGETYLK